MAQDTLTYEDLLRIVELIKSSEQFSEFRLKVGDIEVELRRRPAAMPAAIAPASAGPSADKPETSGKRPVSRPDEAAALGAPPAPLAHGAPSPPSAAPALPDGAVVIRAPMVGTFYRSPEPGAPPFVDVGSFVDDHTTVCIIEVMKLMNSIAAGVRGVVTHVLVPDATSVDTGQSLIVVQPELPAP